MSVEQYLILPNIFYPLVCNSENFIYICNFKKCQSDGTKKIKATDRHTDL